MLGKIESEKFESWVGSIYIPDSSLSISFSIFVADKFVEIKLLSFPQSLTLIR